MSKHRIIFIIGIILLFLPFTGFPSSWKWTLVFLSGIGLIAISVHSSIRRRMLGRRRKKITRPERGQGGEATSLENLDNEASQINAEPLKEVEADKIQ